MNPLNEQQINDISRRLDLEGLTYTPLKEEFLDHLCCMVEENLEAGYSFHQAVEMTFALFPKQDLQEIEQQTLSIIKPKKQIMKLVSLFVLSLLLGGPTLFWTNATIDPPTISPLQGALTVTSGFGMRMHPIHKEKKMHRGVDFRAPIGTPVVATSDGVVLKVRYLKTGYGKHIIIQHDDEYQTLYGQLSKMKVTEGQAVKKGEVIGAVGSSGASTGPHLHYEVLKNGTPDDPEKYMRP